MGRTIAAREVGLAVGAFVLLLVVGTVGYALVARAANEDAAEKLKLAGADRVVQPDATAGQEMAKLVAKPQVAAFLDIVTSACGPDLSIEEIEVTAGSGKRVARFANSVSAT